MTSQKVSLKDIQRVQRFRVMQYNLDKQYNYEYLQYIKGLPKKVFQSEILDLIFLIIFL